MNTFFLSSLILLLILYHVTLTNCQIPGFPIAQPTASSPTPTELFPTPTEEAGFPDTPTQTSVTQSTVTVLSTTIAHVAPDATTLRAPAVTVITYTYNSNKSSYNVNLWNIGIFIISNIVL